MNYKFTLLFGVLIALGCKVAAQNVGIGTNTPHASAKLHIEDANKGFLIPRVSLVAVTNGTTPVSAPVKSLLVFNTNVSVTGGNGEGFYYWDGSVWELIGNGSGGGSSAFSCGDPLVDSRDGISYSTVLIGSQCWMAENIRYVTTSGSWSNPTNLNLSYGRLYDWATAMNIPATNNTNLWGGSDVGHQGICPIGWHIPSDFEWNQMEMELGMAHSDTATQGYRYIHGTYMKSTIGWTSGNGTNSSGINAFPVGYYNSGFSDLGLDAVFWSSTEYWPTLGWIRGLSYGNSGVRRTDGYKDQGMSCRCVKD